MNLTNLTKMAVIGAFALGLAVYVSPSKADDFTTAGPYELDSDNPITIVVGAQVNELVQVQTTEMKFGVIGIHQDKTTNTKATLVMDPTDGTLTDSSAGADARIVADTDTGVSFLPAAASVAITGAFPAAVIYVHYQNVIDLTCDGLKPSSSNNTDTCAQSPLETAGVSGAYTPPTLLLTSIVDDLDTLSNTTNSDGGTVGTAGSITCATGGAGSCTEVDGKATTEASSDTTPGSLTFSLGGTISTDGTTSYYASGLYTGSFDVTMSY